MSKNLEPAEEIIFETRPHWSIFLLPVALLVLGTINWWLFIPAGLILLYDTYKFFSHQFVVTNKRLIQKQGLYHIRIQDWPLHKIEDVICTRTIVDRLLGTGSVVLMGISISTSRLRGVGHPYELRNSIYSQLPTS